MTDKDSCPHTTIDLVHVHMDIVEDRYNDVDLSDSDEVAVHLEDNPNTSVNVTSEQVIIFFECVECNKTWTAETEDGWPWFFATQDGKRVSLESTK